jgi:WD40 repeat protein
MNEEKENRPFIDFVCSLNECKKYLEQPITLPCKIHNICKIHLDSLELKSLHPNGIDHVKYYCAPCGQEFRLDLADINVNLNVSKSINLNEHLTGLQKEVKKSLEQLYSYINDIQLINPKNELFEFFSVIKNEVVIHRNKQIDEITKKSAQIIDQISKFEADCNLNLRNLDTIDVNELKNKKLAEWNQQLRVPNIDTTKLDQLLNEIKSSMQNILTAKRKFKSEIFMNKKIEFKPNESIDFGCLNLTENILQPDDSFRTFQGHQDPIRCALIDSNNKKLISGGHDNKIKIWNLKNGKLEISLNLHKNCVSSLLIAGNKLISGSWDSTIKVWDMKEGFKSTNSIHNDGQVTCLELLSESSVLA